MRSTTCVTRIFTLCLFLPAHLGLALAEGDRLKDERHETVNSDAAKPDDTKPGDTDPGAAAAADLPEKFERHVTTDDLRFLSKRDLVALYEQAVWDFAQEEAELRRNHRGYSRSYRLQPTSEFLAIISSGGTVSEVKLKPGEFSGVGFATPLGEDLINADAGRSADLNLSFGQVYYCAEKHRVQATLQWSATISASYNYLYAVGEGGRLELIGKQHMGCSRPNGMIPTFAEAAAAEKAKAEKKAAAKAKKEAAATK